MRPKILVIEDEDRLRGVLARGLSESGYEVTSVGDGAEGLELALAEAFDCVVLDLMIPGKEGFEVLRELRAAGRETPVLILSARGEVDDRVRGLDTGADDYLGKPFAWKELEARVRACVRRRSAEVAAVVRSGELELNRVEGRVSRGESRVELTPREAKLLEFLMTKAGETATREQLAREVWGDPQAGLTNVIDVYVNYLRKKLEKVGVPGAIRTVRGVGYELRD